MSKAIFITNGDHAFNQSIASRELAGGHRIGLHCTNQVQAEAYRNSLGEGAAERLHLFYGVPADEAGASSVIEDAVAKLGGLDVLIHGNEMLDEDQLFEQAKDELGSLIPSLFQRIFLWNRSAIGYMIKQKSGKVIFPVIYDTLYYDHYPCSPILNHGKISLMKCLSRECSAFRIDVNVVSFGYYDAGFDKAEKKEKQRGLEIYGLKPVLKSLDDMLEVLDFVIGAPGSLIGGQNIEIGVGVETNL
ncbi:SDR family NAD(P)-dependent oxidoreductase [Paenibacillus filicis]|uniref:SDR family NAD(P)-dependent oxidoreductase n=1 Tax=Paenibacillus gyeongsangnamensis TaxID=3388067 RepID=A0ABT4Q8F1_9BACL|nr:SDR family NAD(P)-dependent oxidoreductase [Paenibacillus filicis]MCZ8513158.1 SDR family NAD(P)-dependent oxidoreductase [Paenibacillus filicis]